MGALSIKVTNERCEAACTYCYEHAIRDVSANQADRPLDIDAILRQMEFEYEMHRQKYGRYPEGEPYLHGGEALTAGHETIERIMRKAYELAGRTNIQTYGYLIDEKFIEIFKKYNASVGVSIDGPWPLNKARVVPGRSTKEITEIVHRNLLWLRSEGIPVSIIVVLTKANAAPDKLDQLKDWLRWLKSIGITSGRLNLMHADKQQYGKSLELTEEEAEHAWRELTRFVLTEEDGLHWQPMHDAVSSVLGLEQGTCVFHECTYYRAEAEPVVLSDGTTANCLKTAKNGHIYPRLEASNFEHRGYGGVRYEVLQMIPFELGAKGGCGGCPFWRNCTGGCPSEGINGDWRNKTRFCRAYYGLFDEASKILKRIMPSIITTGDGTPKQFPHKGVQGMNPPAFANMLGQYNQRPSSWRTPRTRMTPQGMPQGGSQGMPQGGPQVPVGSPEIEHIDGEIRHLDSNLAQHCRPQTPNPGQGYKPGPGQGDPEAPPIGMFPEIEHLDGDIRHLDSNLLRREEDETMAKLIDEQLKKANQRLAQMQKGE